MSTEPTATDGADPELLRVRDFAQAYIDAFNSARHRLASAGTRATVYAQELGSACIAIARDGIAIFYFNKETQAKAPFIMPDGAWLYDRRDQHLAIIVQSFTGNIIRIWNAEPGTSAFEARKVPDDLPLGEPIGGVNPAFLEPFLHDPKGMPLTSILVGPLWKVENGLLVRPDPSRIRVISPFAEGPPYGSCLLQLLYPFLDLLWLSDQLDLTTDTAKACVEADIEVLRLGLAAGVPQKQLAEDPFEAVGRHCDWACEVFLQLIDDPTTRESEVQTFLEQPAHSFLISPHNCGVYPRKPLSGSRFIPDFTVCRPDEDYHFIEIESPHARVYQAKGEEPTKEFNHAVQQVEDWLRYIDENLRTVRDEDKMPTIYRPTGEVVIGRDRHLGEKAATRFQFKRAESQRINLKTYDMLLAAGRAYASSIRAIKGHVPSS